MIESSNSLFEVDILYIFLETIAIIPKSRPIPIFAIGYWNNSFVALTALNDAMATILDEGKDDKDVLFFIFTDGFENSSRKHRSEAGRMYCKSLIDRYSRDNNWTVIFGMIGNGCIVSVLFSFTLFINSSIRKFFGPIPSKAESTPPRI